MATIVGIAETRNVFMNGRKLEPGPSQKVWNHSPDGFNWGFGGSGPAQLALAILLKVTDKDTAVKNYQQFKWDHVAKWTPGEDFFVEVDIQEWLEKQAAKRAKENEMPV